MDPSRTHEPAICSNYRASLRLLLTSERPQMTCYSNLSNKTAVCVSVNCRVMPRLLQHMPMMPAWQCSRVGSLLLCQHCLGSLPGPAEPRISLFGHNRCQSWSQAAAGHQSLCGRHAKHMYRHIAHKDLKHRCKAPRQTNCPAGNAST